MKHANVVLGIAVAAAVLVVPPARAQKPDGSDINQAIPIYFGQIIHDTVDSATRPRQVYSIALAQGQQVSVTATESAGGAWRANLYGPTAKTVLVATALAGRGASDANGAGQTFTYQVAAAGTYYVEIATGQSGVAYQLQVTAQGTPISVPNPAQKGCVTGQVDYILYSLQLIAAKLPDEVSIGGTKLCASCDIKPPAYPELVEKMEKSMAMNLNVSACYDSSGNIFQLKLMHP